MVKCWWCVATIISCLIIDDFVGSTRSGKPVAGDLQDSWPGSVRILFECLPSFTKLAGGDGIRLYDEVEGYGWENLPEILH